MSFKVCPGCNIDKQESQYTVNPNSGRTTKYCLSCRKQKSLDNQREYRKKNKEKVLEKQRKYRQENREKQREYKNRYVQNNYEKHYEYRAEYEKKRKQSDPGYRLRKQLRTYFKSAFVRTGQRKSRTPDFKSMVGTSVECFRVYMEFLMQSDMKWDNYGSLWHIDHRIPISAFDLSDPEQAKRAWHFTNMTPMYAIQNIRKSNKFSELDLIKSNIVYHRAISDDFTEEVANELRRLEINEI